MKTFYIVLRAFYAILLFGLVFGTISCADKINTPPLLGSSAGLLIYTKYDNASFASIPNGVMVDSSGTLKSTLTDALSPSIVCDAQGGKILYSTGLTDPTQTTTKLVVANNDNSNQQVIYAATTTQDLQLLSPVLSPDGAFVAYATVDSSASTSSLWVAKSDGTSKRLISGQFNNQTTPCFSEDGKKIVYYTSTNIQGGGQPTLAISTIDQTSSSTITSITGAGVDGAGRISWKHNTNEIAYTDNGAVFVIDVSGNGKMQIDIGITPMWSPDGTQLAYAETNSLDIVVTSDLGLTKTNITNTGTATLEAFPEWSVDGKKILCMSWTGDFDHSTTSLKLIDVSSTQSSKIIATPGIYGYFLK